MKRILPILIILLLTACETERPFPAEESGRIFVHAMMSDSGRSTLDIGVSTPLGSAGTETDPHSVNISLESDGTPVRLTLDEENSTDRILRYYTDEGFRNGQKLRLEADAPGLHSVEAEIMIPEAIPGIEVRQREIECFKQSDSGTSSDHLRTLWELGMIIDEEAEAGDTYAIQVLKRRMYEFIGDVDRKEDYEARMGIIETDDLYVNSTVNSSNEGISSIGTEMVIDFDGMETKIENIVYDNGYTYLTACVKPTERRMVSSSYNPVTGGNYSVYEYYEYKIKVYRLAEEMFNYISARYTADQTPVHLGFTPATYTYTNVIGGIGIFGAAAEHETDWTIFE